MSENLLLKVASGEGSLSIRTFSVSERISALFDIVLSVRTPLHDLDLAGIVGKPASFTIAAHRTWKGVCSELALIGVEETGLSTYRVRIVPALWRLTQRRQRRIFQRLSALEIAQRVLSEWKIEPSLRVDAAAYPRLDYRVQYDETDYDFVRRMLAEAGISFYFAGDGDSVLALSDHPEAAAVFPGCPIDFVDAPNPESRAAYVTSVTLTRTVTPSGFGLRDFDFRNPDRVVEARASSAGGADARLRIDRYAPGSFLAEGAADGATPVADDRGAVRALDAVGQARAARAMEAIDATRTVMTFTTSAGALGAGDVITVAAHPHPLLDPSRRWLIVEAHHQGAFGSEWTFGGRAVPADAPYRPDPDIPRKPRIAGVESAVVVGPEGEEIHVDEFGRVRVQLRWDREGTHTDASSCWVRVSQGWAGPSRGLTLLPRVGQEVLLAFLEGDPDLPVVIGSVFNGQTLVPYRLPEHRTRTVWKSASTPGGGGFNEITMEDSATEELLYVRAQRDLRKTVGRDEIEQTGGNRTLLVEGDLTIEAEGKILIRSEADVFANGSPLIKINAE